MQLLAAIQWILLGALLGFFLALILSAIKPPAGRKLLLDEESLEEIEEIVRETVQAELSSLTLTAPARPAAPAQASAPAAKPAPPAPPTAPGSGDGDEEPGEGGQEQAKAQAPAATQTKPAPQPSQDGQAVAVAVSADSGDITDEAPPEAGLVPMKIHYAGQTHLLWVKPDENILDAALDRNVELEYSCKEGACRTCRVKILKGAQHQDPVNAEEREMLDEDELNEGWRLSCVRLVKGPLEFFQGEGQD